MTLKKQYHYRLECGHRRNTYKHLHEGDIFGNSTGETKERVAKTIKPTLLYCTTCDDWFKAVEILPTIGRFK